MNHFKFVWDNSLQPHQFLASKDKPPTLGAGPKYSDIPHNIKKYVALLYVFFNDFFFIKKVSQKLTFKDTRP